MSRVQDCHALTNYFVKAYEAKYDEKPNVNRFAARWGFEAVLDSMRIAVAKDLIDYYLSTFSTNGHSLDWFFYNYDKLIDSRKKAEADKQYRAELRVESEERARRWDEKRGNTRTPND